MATGPGKYDDLANYVRLMTQAQCVAVMVIDGNHGHGFSVQGTLDGMRHLPELLRKTADAVELDVKRLEREG